jgi:hypothetical protein
LVKTSKPWRKNPDQSGFLIASSPIVQTNGDLFNLKVDCYLEGMIIGRIPAF